MSIEHIYKSHKKTLLLYHLVFLAKYRKKVFDENIDKKYNIKRDILRVSKIKNLKLLFLNSKEVLSRGIIIILKYKK